MNVYYPEEEVLAVDDSWTVLTPVRNLWKSENVKHISTRVKKQKVEQFLSIIFFVDFYSQRADMRISSEI